MSPKEARAAARRAFGDREAIERELAAGAAADTNRWTGGEVMESLWQDVRFALRGLRKSPGFTLVALLTLALGIGANTGVYSVVDGVFLRAPEIREPGSLVNVYTTCRRGDPRCSSSYPDYLDYREADALDDLAATSWTSLNVADEGRPSMILTGMLVSGNYFDLLGLAPAEGRLIQPADDVVGRPARVVVLAHDTWRARFGADPDIVGRTLRLNGDVTEVIGVAPPGFNGTGLTDDPDLFLPITTAGGNFEADGAGAERTRGAAASPPGGPLLVRGARWMDKLVGRLAPGATLNTLDAEMTALSESLRALDPDARGPRNITVESAARLSLPQFGREDLTRFVLLLGGVVGFTLLLACANVANLLLARGTRRRAEIGIRKAIGASRGRVVRQLTVEAVVLAVLGGVLGLGVAQVVVGVLSSTSLPGGVQLADLGVGLDTRVLLFAVALSLVTGLAFGLAPALRTGAQGLAAVLRGEGSSRSRGGNRLRKTLIAVQVGLCLTLLVGSGLFLQTLRDGLTRDLGFEPEGAVAARFSLAALGYDEADGTAAGDRIARAMERLPSVTSASWYSRIPLQAGGGMGVFGAIEGYEAAPNEEIRVEIVVASAGALETLGIPLQEGLPSTGVEDVPSAWINAVMVDRYFDGRSPIGREIVLNGDPYRVAGVTPDTDWYDVAEEPVNEMLLSVGQREVVGRMPITVVARTTGDPARMLDALRQEVRTVAPDVAFMWVRPVSELVESDLATQRLAASLLTAFGFLALALATIGIGGVVAYLVDQRRRDIGLRMALGASTQRILGELGREMAAPVGTGAMVGLGLALLLGRTIEGFLLETSARAPLPYLAAVVFLLVVAAAAVLLPARGAARVQPMESLRRD